MARFLAHLPPDLAASFTAPQCAAIELHFAMRYRVNHAINWRRRIGFGLAKFYLVILAGREYRGRD